MLMKENPTLDYIYEIKKEIPAYERVIKIIEKEIECNNKISDIGDAATMPDETYIIIRFKYDANDEYEGLKYIGTSCKSVTFCDNYGATSIWFGAE